METSSTTYQWSAAATAAAAVVAAAAAAPSAKAQAKNRQSVSAEVYGEWNKKKDFVPPTEAQGCGGDESLPLLQEDGCCPCCCCAAAFAAALSLLLLLLLLLQLGVAVEMCLLASLDVEDEEVVLKAFEEVSVMKGERLIEQGADGDRLYLIEEGEAAVYKETVDEKTGQKQSQQVNTMKPGDTVGELALMYNAPRAATVIAASDLKLWSLDRETFTRIVRDAAARKRELYEESLKEVALLKDVDPYERSKIADALKTQDYEAGDEIIKEGQEGDTFFLLLDGEAEAIKNGKVVMRYTRGGYFGELALLKNQPRAATVVAKTHCKLAFLERKSFKRLLGPLEALLMRNMDHYRQVMQQLGLDTKYLDN
ncbi:hypothetical protein Emed_003358 [Eimeria media]